MEARCPECRGPVSVDSLCTWAPAEATDHDDAAGSWEPVGEFQPDGLDSAHCLDDNCEWTGTWGECNLDGDDNGPAREPHLIESQAEIDGYKQFPFPNRCGQPKPEGWEKVRDLFCDSSGCGTPVEPALTIEQVKAELRPGFAYAITDEGQFQLYVTEYKRVGT